PALGRALFDSLECRACHTLDANGANSTMVDLHRISEKFPDRRRLGQYLRDPGRHFKWTRMPNFRLTAEEAAHLASFLMPQDGTPTAPAREDDPARIGRGRVLAGERGCFNCHKNPDEDTAISPPASISMAPGFEALARDPGSSGCLAVTNDVDSTRPERRAAYDFRESDRADLAAFLSTGAESLGRHVPAEFAERWSAELRCGECHGKVEGIPALIGVGEKLRPEWVERMLRGEVTYKPRPWLASRMPAFSMVATELAEGYAALEGLPAIASDRDPTPHPPDPEAAAVGRKLVSASAGFSCVTCHPVGPFVASAVFEAPGINLAHAVDRLRPDFFMRWVRNPQAFDPGTRMPLYFDEEGNSALTEYYGGDGPKTLHALWEYLRAGPHLVPPDP
ncbi:MAG: cytochrome c family protein, partial [Limisphaerales bacterium]